MECKGAKWSEWEIQYKERGVMEMANFVDEYARQLDERGRIILPAKVREKISSTVFITRAPSDKCLHLYTEDEWEKMSEKIRSLPTATDKNAAAFVRLFFGKASACEVDKQGRIALAKRLIDYAGIEKDVVLVGANTRLEIWNSEVWEEYQSGLTDDIVVDGIMKYDLNI